MKIGFASWLFIGIFGITVIFQSCINDNFDFNPDNSLEFSLDTLRFDTVFTTIGSATRTLKVYNPNEQGVTIEDIRISTGANTKFRINIDGIPGNEASNIEILPNDSLYIFVEVTVDPDAPLSVSPYIIEEYLQFSTNGNMQEVLLEAWGQNANYVPNRNAAGGFALLSCDFGTVTWDDPKPYVIYGWILVDSCQLVLPAGTDVYFHGGLARFEEFIYNDGFIGILANGSIRAEGELGNPVTFQGDRLEESFQDDLGQWRGILLSAGSKNNYLDNVIIRNSIIGIRADSTAELTIKNSEIFNTSNAGLIGQLANIYAENCLIHTNGANSVGIQYGGLYEFNHCTFANYGNQASAISLGNSVQRDSIIFVAPLIANFTNCIFAGSGADEIDLLDENNKMDPEFFQVQFDNCIVKVDDLLGEMAYPEFFDFCNNCIQIENGDTLFVDVDMQDFHLDTMSIAENKGLFLNNIPTDIEGNMRDMDTPDIGCYEFQ